MPPSWAHILNCAKHCFDTIKYTILNSSDSSSCVTRDVLTFARRENESVTQFIKRVESKTDFDDKFSLDQQDNGEDKEEKMDDKTTPQPDPCLAVYWGTNPPSQLLVKGSIIISKKDPKLDREDVSWTTDPFASF